MCGGVESVVVHGVKPQPGHAPKVVETSTRGAQEERAFDGEESKRLAKLKDVVDVRPYVDKAKPQVICSYYSHHHSSLLK